MIRYYYTKLRLFFLIARTTRLQKKLNIAQSKLSLLKTAISAGFTTEKQFKEFNKRLMDNRNKVTDPTDEKRLGEIRNKHYNNWKPKKHFKDSKNKQAINEGNKRSEYVRVLKNRTLRRNPDDLISPPPQGDNGMLNPDDERNRKENRNG